MSNIEILSLIVTIICLISFCLVFTFLFRHYYLNNINEISSGRADLDLLDFNKERIEKGKLKSEKTKKIVGKTFGYIFFAAVLVFFGFSLYSRFFNNNLIFGDSGFVVISSGSMSERNEVNTYLDEYKLDNQFDTYDIIGISKYESIDEVKQYDVVAFYGNDDVIYVHRIIDVRDDNTFVTRGDSNAISDTNRLYNGYLNYDRIIGFYNGGRVPLIGVFIVFLQSNSGIITVVSIVYCLLMFDHYKTKYDESIENRIKYLDENLNFNYSFTGNIEENVQFEYKEIATYDGITKELFSTETIEKQDEGVELKSIDKLISKFKNFTNKFRKGDKE